jgi:anaerobic selenocysteine-containing dehydrogenase
MATATTAYKQSFGFETETAMAATQHYAIRPKSDLILLYGLANRLIADGWIDRD